MPVATEPPAAAHAGQRLLAEGGNAMDAAAGACLACCVLIPELVDLGGYLCVAVVLEAGGAVTALDANSRAPAAAHESMFEVLPKGSDAGLNETEYGCSVARNANVVGPRAVGVPGTMAGIGTLWERWGRLPWRSVVRPALELATADQAATLRRLTREGWQDFYRGGIAAAIAEAVCGAGGMLTAADMARYEPVLEAPLHTPFREAGVYSAGLPGGGATVLQILNMIEALDRPAGPHEWAEVLKLAWRDRLQYFGDPDFTPVPARLLTRDYAAGRVETVNQFPTHVDRLVPERTAASPAGTVHVSAADQEGNVVSVTVSQGLLHGSRFAVPGSGIVLGHGMSRFDPRPGLPNSVAPWKRPLHNVAPLIVRMPGRDVALGLRGGRYIVSVAARMAEALVTQHASLSEICSMPRLHVQAREPVEVSPDFNTGSLAGHEIRVVEMVGGPAFAAEFCGAA